MLMFDSTTTHMPVGTVVPTEMIKLVTLMNNPFSREN